jgi:hypothetical protein
MLLMTAPWQKTNYHPKRAAEPEETGVNPLCCPLTKSFLLKSAREIKPSAIGSEVKPTRETFRSEKPSDRLTIVWTALLKSTA